MSSKEKIKIAGIGFFWDAKYAVLYKDALIEMGFEARLLDAGLHFYVAYCPIPFEHSDALDVLRSLGVEQEGSNGLAIPKKQDRNNGGDAANPQERLA